MECREIHESSWVGDNVCTAALLGMMKDVPSTLGDRACVMETRRVNLEVLGCLVAPR